MVDFDELIGAKEKLLFTPGPLTTSPTVKQAMLRDVGSRDGAFVLLVRQIRQRLLELGQVGEAGYEAVLMQGSGTFGVEAVFSSLTPPNGKWLIVVNGAYGRRMVQICRALLIAVEVYEVAEAEQPDPTWIAKLLDYDLDVTHVAVVHCETTTGIFNPIAEIGAVVKNAGKLFFVDGMSSFGAVPLNLESAGIDILVSSANKCIQGVPGFSFALIRRQLLLAGAGYARSLALDLFQQWRGLEQNGQFRFTPPTHALLAFAQALQELEEEGGVNGRAARYRQNHQLLVAGMRALGFREYLRPVDQGYIITSFHYPVNPYFNFEQFYSLLNEQGLVIYPGKVSHADCFRIGHIGHIFAADVLLLLTGIEQALSKMGIVLPLQS